MVGIALSILLKGLDFGKVLLGWIWDIVKGIFKFAFEKPFQFLTIVLSLALLIAGWYGISTTRELSESQKIVEEKVTFIKGQDIKIKEYVKALDVEKKNHVASIDRSNKAVSNLKKAADEALARANAAGRQAIKDKAQFDQLGRDYGRANNSKAAPAERIKREEATNDSFITEWKKAQ
jgi:hypothetical protein